MQPVYISFICKESYELFPLYLDLNDFRLLVLSLFN
jgi:hypothetical protein